MLQYLRKASEKTVAKILIGLLSFSFVGWGVASWVVGESSTQDSIAHVGSQPIKISEFENIKSREISRMSREQQKQLYTAPGAMTQFYGQILSNLTSRALLDNRAEFLGLNVSNAAIAGIIRRTPDFQINGKFSPEKFDAILYSAGLSEDNYANYVRGEVLRSMATSGISVKLSAPEFASVAFYKSRYALRKIEFSKISYSDFGISKNPTDAQLAEVYAQNPKIIPEVRNVNYVFVNAKMANPDSYDNGYAIAQKLEDAIIGGESMQDAAKKHGAKFVSVNSLSANKKSGDSVLTDSMVAKIFEMDSGIESEITEINSGFVILRVEKIITAHAAPLSTVRNEITKLWRLNEQKKSAYIKANELLTAKKFGGQTITVGRTDGAPIDVLNAVFANSVGTNTIVPGANAFYVLSIKQEIQPKIDGAKLAAIKQESNNLMQRILSDDYTSFLSREYPVKVNKRVYKKYFSNNDK